MKSNACLDEHRGELAVGDNSAKTPLIVICGPTASGKTSLGIELCKLIDGEVVSADSMQVYRGMDVGTAKPDKREQAGVTHHLLNVADPSVNFSVAAYRELAERAIEEIASRGKRAVMVGGTGLYINAVTRPMGFAACGDAELRATLQLEADRDRIALHERLRAVDPKSAARLHPNDVRRVIRALEIATLTGKTITELNALDARREGKYSERLFALEWPREELYARINARVDAMLASGLVDEVRALSASEVSSHATAMQAIGYKEIRKYLDGATSLDEATELIKRGTRNYAKRQLSWFRGDARVTWLDAKERQAREWAELIAKQTKV